jgi:hypothetical protein
MPFSCRIWRKRRARSSEYHKVMELHEEDEPPFFQHNQYRDSSASETPYELRRLSEDTLYVPEEHHRQVPLESENLTTMPHKEIS